MFYIGYSLIFNEHTNRTVEVGMQGGAWLHGAHIVVYSEHVGFQAGQIMGIGLATLVAVLKIRVKIGFS